MFAPIYLNLQRSVFATGASKTTFYRWLCGAEPSLRHLAALAERLSIQITIPYLNKFNKAALQLARTDELQKISTILEASGLAPEDITLLSEYHKKRIWKKVNNVLNAEDLLDEC